MSNLPHMAPNLNARLPALTDCSHDMLPPIPGDRYTGRPLAQGTSFQLVLERALDVVVGLHESGQAGRVLKIGAMAAEDLNPSLETCLESSC